MPNTPPPQPPSIRRGGTSSAFAGVFFLVCLFVALAVALRAQTTVFWRQLGNIPSPTISATGDATGTVTLSNSGGATLGLTLADSGASAGTYKSVTVDAKGRVTGGTNPTTLSGYGITDAQPLDSDLTSIAALTTTTFGRSLLAFASANSSVLYTDGSGNWVLGTTLPAVSGANLTALNATQLTSGTLPAARLPAFSGDITTSAGSAATTLATVNSNVGTFGSPTQSLTATVNGKGLITAVSAATVTPAWSSITSKPTTLAGYGITDANTSASTAALLAARGHRDWLASDPSSTSSRAYWPLGTVGAGLGDFTLAIAMVVPTTASPGASGWWAIANTSNANNGYTGTAPLRVQIENTTNNLVILLGPQSNNSAFPVSGFRSTYAGQAGLLVVWRTGSTFGAEWNGIPLTLSAPTQSGSWPALDTALTADYLIAGASGSTVPGVPLLGTPLLYNVALSSTERTALRDVGPEGLPQYRSGLFSASNGFSRSGDSGTTLSATSATGFTATFSSLAGNSFVNLTYPVDPRAFGQQVRVRFTVTVASGTAPIIGYTGTKIAGVTAGSRAVSGQSYDLTMTIGSITGSEFYFYNLTGETGQYTVSSFQLDAQGLLVRPTIQPIAIVADAGVNAIGGVLINMLPVTTRRDWIIQANTSTNGNQQLLGASPFFDYSRNIIDDWVVNNKGGSSRTISLGQASAGTQYLSGGTAATGRNVVSLATRVIGANALWCNSNGTDSLQHTIRGHIVD